MRLLSALSHFIMLSLSHTHTVFLALFAWIYQMGWRICAWVSATTYNLRLRTRRFNFTRPRSIRLDVQAKPTSSWSQEKIICWFVLRIKSNDSCSSTWLRLAPYLWTDWKNSRKSDVSVRDSTIVRLSKIFVRPRGSLRDSLKFMFIGRIDAEHINPKIDSYDTAVILRSSFDPPMRPEWCSRFTRHNLVIIYRLFRIMRKSGGFEWLTVSLWYR